MPCLKFIQATSIHQCRAQLRDRTSLSGLGLRKKASGTLWRWVTEWKFAKTEATPEQDMGAAEEEEQRKEQALGARRRGCR